MILDFSAMLTYFLTLLCVFFGVYVGVILAFIASEELKNGKKYFRGMMDALVGFILALLLYFYGVNLYLIIIVSLSTVILLYLLHTHHMVEQIVYFLLGIVFLFSAKQTELFIANSAMIFLFGLPLGSNYVERNIKKSKKTILSDVFLVYGAFVVIALLANLIRLQIVKFG